MRGAGLFLGVEFVKDRKSKEPAPEETARVVNDLRRRKVLISATGIAYGVAQIAHLSTDDPGLALVLARATLQKFGGDSLAETRRNVQAYLESVAQREPSAEPARVSG